MVELPGVEEARETHGRKYRGEERVDQLVFAEDIEVRPTVKRPSPFAKVSTWLARRRRAPWRTRTSLLRRCALINGMRYYGDGSNGRVNGPGHLTPCVTSWARPGAGPTSSLFVPFRHDHVAGSFHATPVAAAFLVAFRSPARYGLPITGDLDSLSNIGTRLSRSLGSRSEVGE